MSRKQSHPAPLDDEHFAEDAGWADEYASDEEWEYEDPEAERAHRVRRNWIIGISAVLGVALIVALVLMMQTVEASDGMLASERVWAVNGSPFPVSITIGEQTETVPAFTEMAFPDALPSNTSQWPEKVLLRATYEREVFDERSIPIGDDRFLVYTPAGLAHISVGVVTYSSSPLPAGYGQGMIGDRSVVVTRRESPDFVFEPIPDEIESNRHEERRTYSQVHFFENNVALHGPSLAGRSQEQLHVLRGMMADAGATPLERSFQAEFETLKRQGDLIEQVEVGLAYVRDHRLSPSKMPSNVGSVVAACYEMERAGIDWRRTLREAGVEELVASGLGEGLPLAARYPDALSGEAILWVGQFIQEATYDRRNNMNSPRQRDQTRIAIGTWLQDGELSDTAAKKIIGAINDRGELVFGIEDLRVGDDPDVLSALLETLSIEELQQLGRSGGLTHDWLLAALPGALPSDPAAREEMFSRWRGVASWDSDKLRTAFLGWSDDRMAKLLPLGSQFALAMADAPRETQFALIARPIGLACAEYLVRIGHRFSAEHVAALAEREETVLVWLRRYLETRWVDAVAERSGSALARVAERILNEESGYERWVFEVLDPTSEYGSLVATDGVTRASRGELELIVGYPIEIGRGVLQFRNRATLFAELPADLRDELCALALETPQGIRNVLHPPLFADDAEEAEAKAREVIAEFGTD